MPKFKGGNPIMKKDNKYKLAVFEDEDKADLVEYSMQMQKSIEKLIVVSTCLYFVKLIFWKSAAEPLHLDLLWAHYIHTL